MYSLLFLITQRYKFESNSQLITQSNFWYSIFGNDEASISTDGIVGLISLRLVVAYKTVLVVPIGIVGRASGVELIAPYEGTLRVGLGIEEGGE